MVLHPREDTPLPEADVVKRHSIEQVRSACQSFLLAVLYSPTLLHFWSLLHCLSAFPIAVVCVCVFVLCFDCVCDLIVLLAVIAFVICVL